MADFFKIRESNLQFLKAIPLYYQSEGNKLTPFKYEGGDLSKTDELPTLFVHKDNQGKAVAQITKGLNYELERQFDSPNIFRLKTVICQIMHEVLLPGQKKAAMALNDTIDIIIRGAKRNYKFMKELAEEHIDTELAIVEHCVNVMALALAYCFCKRMPEKETRILGLCGLLHDMGTAFLDHGILKTTERLSQGQFEQYKKHPELGHDMLIMHTDFNIAVANVALEHHERLDKSGYPTGTNIICWQSQAIGFIDSFEALTFRNKAFRKAKKPYDTLNLMKKEVLAGKFDLQFFKEFTTCLLK